MRSRRATALSIVHAALIVVLAPAIATAQDQFGLRVGVSTNSSAAMVGADLLLPMAHHWTFAPNVELTFGNSANTAEISGDFHYAHRRRRLIPTSGWAQARRSSSATSTAGRAATAAGPTSE